MTAPRTLHKLRVRWRAVAAEVAALVQSRRVHAGDANCTDAHIAASLEISRTSVSRYFDPASGDAWTLGDIGALSAVSRDLALDILDAFRARIAGTKPAAQCPRATVDHVALLLQRATRELMDDLADDGRVNSFAAHERNFAALEEIARRGREACAWARENGGAA